MRLGSQAYGRRLLGGWYSGIPDVGGRISAHIDDGIARQSYEEHGTPIPLVRQNIPAGGEVEAM